jgi:hypothetical protein
MMNVVISALYSPEAAMQRVREKGYWFAPLLVMCVMALLAVWLQWPIIEKMTLSQLTEQEGVSKDTILLFAKISTYVFAVIGVIIVPFITALLLMLINMLIQGEAKYMQLFKVACYSAIPGSIGGLITAVMARATNAESINDVVLSLGALLPEKKGFLFALANLVNPFSIWGLVLLVVGMAVMSGRPVPKAAPYVVIVWIVLGMLSGLLSG